MLNEVFFGGLGIVKHPADASLSWDLANFKSESTPWTPSSSAVLVRLIQSWYLKAFLDVPTEGSGQEAHLMVYVYTAWNTTNYHASCVLVPPCQEQHLCHQLELHNTGQSSIPVHIKESLLLSKTALQELQIWRCNHVASAVWPLSKSFTSLRLAIFFCSNHIRTKCSCVKTFKRDSQWYALQQLVVIAVWPTCVCRNAK